MSTVIKSGIIILILTVGGISFTAGTYSLFSLYEKSGDMKHTVGVVTHLTTERTYRHRKIYYKHTARIQYDTELYKTHIRRQLHNPFISEGSELALWYNPDRTEEVVIPTEEAFIWGSTLIFGVLCLLTGALIAKTQKHKTCNQ